MNERIQRLFKHAGGKTSIHNLMSNPMQQREYNELWDDRIDKFAELIIRECVDVLDNDDGATHHRECLFEHFGVK